MTAYTNILFPSFQLPSGRWVKIDMSTQDVTGGVIGAPYQGAQETMEVNPWAAGGLPKPEEAAAAESGIIGIDAIDFIFHNVPIKPSVDTTTLYDVLTVVKPETTVWNIRYWISTNTGGVAGTYNTEPDFWGWVEASEPEGRIFLTDDTWNTYKCTAKNRITLLEKVPVETWIGTHLTHDVYDFTPGDTIIDGVTLTDLYISNGDGTNTTHFDVRPATREVYVKMFRLVDVLYSLSAAMGITEQVNDIATGNGSVPMTWEFIHIDSPGLTPNETSATFDDLYIVSSLYHSNGLIMVHDQKWTFFDNEKLSGISVYNFSNAFEALRMFVVPFGLNARLRTNASGAQYMAVEEMELADETTATIADVLEELTVEPGDKARYGCRVTTTMNGEITDGDSADINIEQPYQGATRIRLSERWINVPGVTDDITCLNASLYVISGGDAVNIFKIKPKRDGSVRVTASPRVMPSPPAVYPNWTGLSPIERQREEAGSVMAKACLAYHWNGHADPATDPVGVHRRYSKKLSWGETGLKTTIAVGTIRTVAGEKWIIRKRTIDAREDRTDFEGERGTYNASP